MSTKVSKTAKASLGTKVVQKVAPKIARITQELGQWVAWGKDRRITAAPSRDLCVAQAIRKGYEVA